MNQLKPNNRRTSFDYNSQKPGNLKPFPISFEAMLLIKDNKKDLDMYSQWSPFFTHMVPSDIQSESLTLTVDNKRNLTIV